MSRKIYIVFAVFIVSLFSCKSEVTKKKAIPENSKHKVIELSKNKNKMDSLLLEDGLKIHWIKKGKGPNIQANDCIDIDYKVFLSNGKLIEGNHLLNKVSFPFIVGFGMQTKGWDIALQNMREGDEVEIFIPSQLARGEQGIAGIIPPNASNIVYIKVLKIRAPDRQKDGTKVYLFEENVTHRKKFNTKNTIVFHAMISSPSNALYFNSFRTNKPFTASMKDAGLIPGLKKALNSSKKSDRMYVVVPSEEAYGTQGYLDLVKSNEPLLFNIFVMDVF